MAEAGVYPTNVRDRISHSLPDAVIVGDPDTLWGDGSDSTYAYREDSESANGIILGDVAAWTRGPIQSVTCDIRLVLGNPDPDTRFDLWAGPLGTETPAIETGPNAFFLADEFGATPTAPVGVGTTVTGLVLCDSITGAPLNTAQLRTLFSLGFTVGVARVSTAHPTSAAFYTVAFQVVYTPAAVPPRRQYPYPGTRVYPPVFTTRGGTAAIV